jgi:phage gpG-like protein
VSLELSVKHRLRDLAPPARAIFENRWREFTKRAEQIARLNASGRVLQQRSGRLARSIRGVVRRVGKQTREAALTADTAYAAIQELGGVTRPHEILPVRASVLRFEVGGRVVFARRVSHPGSTIPPRPYLSPAWRDAAPGFEAAVNADLADLARGTER